MGGFLCREHRKCKGGNFFALFYTVFKASAFWFGLEVYCLKLTCFFFFFEFWFVENGLVHMQTKGCFMIFVF